MSLLLSPKGRTRRLQRRTLSRLYSLCSRPSHHLSAPPSSASSPFPYPYRVIGMVMIGIVGHTRSTNLGRAPPRSSRRSSLVSPKRQLRDATLAPSCSYYASCAGALADCRRCVSRLHMHSVLRHRLSSP